MKRLSDIYRKNFTKRNRKRSRSIFQGQLENLEGRQLMAGDVTAVVSNGTLFIEGDSSNNNIEVRQLSDGSIRIQNDDVSDVRLGIAIINPAIIGGRGEIQYNSAHRTLINGGLSDTITGSFNNLNIQLGGGEDKLDLHDIDIPWDVDIDMGTGADDVRVDNVTTGDDLIVRSGGGGVVWNKDNITITNSHIGSSSSLGNDLYVYGTPGVEEIAIVNVTAEDDLLIYATKENEPDRTFLSGGNRVLGDWYGGTTRVDSDFLYVYDLETDADGDFRRVNYLDVSQSTFGDDLWVDGTSRADTLTLGLNLEVDDDADVEAFAGDDSVTILGSQGFKVSGGDDNDTIIGGSGDDNLFGNNGNDILKGGDGEDNLHGGNHRDRLYGGAHRDVLKGGSGDDFLNGGSHHDDLFGDAGRDALFGGIGNDTHDGGSGADRFLILRDHANALGLYSDDIIEDMFAEDVQIYFDDFDQVTIPLNGLNWTTFSAGEWQDDDIDIVDDAFHVMVSRTGNNGLLSNGMVFGRVGNNLTGNGFTAYNSPLGQSVYSNSTFANRNEAMKTVFHEIGHDWDDENPYWSEFMALSGWTQVIGWGDTLHTQCEDFQNVVNQWWYRTSSSGNFARTYGKTNPMEDFATTFAAYFMDWGANNTEYTTLNYGSTGNITAKLDLIDNWLDEV